VIVDTTAGLLSLIVFALLGIALLLHEGSAAQAAAQLTIGIVILGIISVAFFLAQRAGVILMFARLVEHASKDGEWRALTGGATALNRSVVCLYGRSRAIMVASGWRLVGWLLGTGEVWLALYFLGQPVGLSEALILESLVQTLRAAAFAIPGALGVQETGFVLLGGMLGLNPETALALSLVKRVRELALGLPGLIAWQITEGHRIWRQQMPES
jgi:putative membrane protein